MRALRGGFTTGTCAAAAAKAATQALVNDISPREVEIGLPDRDRVTLPILYTKRKGEWAEAAVRKDAGDDPDITDGLAVVASVTLVNGNSIILTAGEGVGMVTKPGLSVPPGEPAINPVPRQMIQAAIAEVTAKAVKVTISIPGGRELAARTFNPRLGIAGGLSVLGTSGRVRPFSNPALRSALKCLLDVAVAADVSAPVFVPGHIGEKAARRHFSLTSEQVIEVSNEWGFMLDLAAQCNFSGLLALGHPGKLAKLAAGEWDTHSSRSSSAVNFVVELAAEVLGRHLTEVLTVEGLFSSLPAQDRKRLGDSLAGKIRQSVAVRMRGDLMISTVLVNMKGEIIGSCGALDLWK